ncbi:hypothetical protein AMS68_002695 [Peltaster fructicola]|uniref:RRM domain-containing protein n=1 Tax=Peltaster fructicola TaxID=286661 RepID=A0A6H0XRB1_9PEZI|nr:hypothetical protein AMS68_002695 [Peltaster fructicola]
MPLLWMTGEISSINNVRHSSRSRAVLTSSALRSVAPQAVIRTRVTQFHPATPSRYFSQIRPRFAEEKEPAQAEPSAEELKEVREESILEPDVAQSGQEAASTSSQAHAATSESTDQLPHEGYVADVSKSTDSSEQQVAATSESTAQTTRRRSGANIYIGNLFFEVQVEQLKETFSKFGEVLYVRIPVDERGQSKGFGFVDFASREAAERAVDEFNDQLLFGRRAVVSMSRDQGHRPKSSTYTSPKNPPSKTLFIGNMSYQMSDRDLNDLFRECKNVLDVRVAIDRRTGQPRGFAHADFETVAAAETAAKQLSNKTIYGRTLKIDFTQPTQVAPRSSEL